MSACFCIGPQNGEPLCPCEMKGLIKRNGRWIRSEQDLGPVRDPEIIDPYGNNNGPIDDWIKRQGKSEKGSHE